MTVLGLVLARGGSKRVPRKNLRSLGGKPLIGWTIMAARYARLIDRLVVSSDDDEILDVAKRWKAEPLKRPVELATDGITSYPAMLHALDTVGAFDWLCLLQPTSPFRSVGDIDKCLIWAGLCGKPAIVSVEMGKTVPNGAIYVCRPDWLRTALAEGVELPFDMPGLAKFPMPAERSIDIDTEEDFERAEAMVKEKAA